MGQIYEGTDGGITSNTFIMQFLANLLGISVSKIAMSDVSALGAAYLAGLQTGIYKDLDTLKNLNAHKTNQTFSSLIFSNPLKPFLNYPMFLNLYCL